MNGTMPCFLTTLKKNAGASTFCRTRDGPIRAICRGHTGNDEAQNMNSKRRPVLGTPTTWDVMRIVPAEMAFMRERIFYTSSFARRPPSITFIGPMHVVREADARAFLTLCGGFALNRNRKSRGTVSVQVTSSLDEEQYLGIMVAFLRNLLFACREFQ